MLRCTLAPLPTGVLRTVFFALPFPLTKGKSAIHLAGRVYSERKRNFVVQSFWARSYFVSTVGRDEGLIRKYIQHQEYEDAKLEQLGLRR